jgi:hypothetical protein
VTAVRLLAFLLGLFGVRGLVEWLSEFEDRSREERWP